MLGEMKLVLKSNFESLPLFEPSFTQFTTYQQENLPSRYEEGTRFFLSQFRYAKLNETISSTPFMLLMMHLFMLLTTLSEISLYNMICFKWSKTFEYICTHCCENEISDLGISIP